MMSDNEIRLLGFRSQHSVWWRGGSGCVWEYVVWVPAFCVVCMGVWGLGHSILCGGGGEWGLSQHSVYEGGEYGGVWKFTGVWGPSFLCWWDYMGVRGALLCGGGGSIWGCVTIY